MEIQEVHISTIKVGDTILHNGEVTTVNKNYMGYSSFMGHSLFGYSYKLGTVLVKKIISL